MIVITGGAGFIGSAAAWRLNQLGNDKLILVDELRSGEKWRNLNGLKYHDFYHKNDFISLIYEDALPCQLDAVLHLGACSATTEKDADYLMDNNFKYSQVLANYCIKKDIRFVYASSAATYGDGSNGYDDDESRLHSLRPLNMYGYSKHLFDSWIKRMNWLDKVAGVKYFNVYGPNEYHKNDMRSVVHKSFEQIKSSGKVQLFKSYENEYKDGEQMRDFVYVKDAVDMTLFLLENRNVNGIYNVGCGKARTWVDLVSAVFSALGKTPNIDFIEMPEDIRAKYQYFTEANIGKIRNAGYKKDISSLEEGIEDYVKNYLLKEKYLAMETGAK